MLQSSWVLYILGETMKTCAKRKTLKRELLSYHFGGVNLFLSKNITQILLCPESFCSENSFEHKS